MKIHIDFNSIKNVVNPKFYPLLKDSNRYLICYGSAGSSKSYFLIQKFLYRILRSFVGHYKEKFLFLRKHNVDCRRTVFSLTKHLISEYNMGPLCKINESSMSIVFKNGSEILHLGIDDPEKIKSIPNVTSVFCEEFSDFEKNDFQQLDLRLRGQTPSYKQIACAFNPITANHWIKKYFFDITIKNCTLHHSTYKDNKWLDKEYRHLLESITDPVFHQVYTLGKWGMLQESIYQNFEILDLFIIKDTLSNHTCGLDFGHGDPTALVHVALDDAQNVYVLDEFYRRGLSNVEIYTILKPWKDFQIFCDTDPAKLKDFTQQSFKMRAAVKGAGSVMLGIDWLRCRKIFIDKSCVNFIREIQSYVYKKDRQGNILDYTPVKHDDHLMDALRYSVSGLSRPMKFEYAVGSRRESSYMNAYY